MLTIKQIREHNDFVVERLKVKGFDAGNIVNEIIELDDKRKAIQTRLDANLAEQNSIAKQIGILFKQGAIDEANLEKQKSGSLKDVSKQLQDEQVEVEKLMLDKIVLLPNIPHESVPLGKLATDNVEIRKGGVIPELRDAIPHWELAKKYDIIDFELGVKLTGAGFPVYKGQGARLQRALIAMFLDLNTEAGYLEIEPPIMINEDSGFGTGQLPDKEGQMYHVGIDNFYLIPTAEVPVTNIYRDTILNKSDFPVKMTAYTPCFRREAGSYGKDVRGLNRLHQFDKVEIVELSLPEKSQDALERMVAHVESIIQKLELPYRIIRLCGGDMSFASALTYDFEVYSAAQDRWLEVSSVSNFESFQANRLKLRFRDENKKTQLAHTLNGSALALPRIVAALLENNQTPDGIVIPDALSKYTGYNIINNNFK